MRSPSRTQPLAAAATLVALTLASCGANNATADKSGGNAEPVTLRLGTPESREPAYYGDLEHFAASVASLSGGVLDVEIVYDAAAPYDAESELRLARMVSAGDIDLAIVPARAWDLVEITDFRALQTPFLVDSLPLLAEVAQSDFADEMLAGLGRIGVTGLALLPESLRHPISYGEPMLTAADLAGAKLRVPTSDLSQRLAEALGIEAVFPDDPTAALIAGELDGAESAFVWNHTLPAFGTFTADVTFYPKANTLVVNGELFDGLGAEHQQVLRDAAAETVAYDVETRQSESELAAAYCEAGGGAALAGEGAIAELVALAEPVRAELEQDETTAGFIADLEALKAEFGPNPDVVEPCGLGIVTTEPAAGDSAPSSPTEFPDGLYRGDTQYGLITMEFADGTMKLYHPDGSLDCTFTYDVAGGRVFLTSSSDPQYACGNPPNYLFFDAEFSLDGDQLLLTDIDSDPNAVKDFGVPWTRIGDAEPTAADGSAPPAASEFPEGTFRGTAETGVWTMEVADGEIKLFIEGDPNPNPCVFTYEVTESRVFLTDSTDPRFSCGYPPDEPFFDAEFALVGDRLRFNDVQSVAPVLAPTEWTKIE